MDLHPGSDISCHISASFQVQTTIQIISPYHVIVIGRSHSNALFVDAFPSPLNDIDLFVGTCVVDQTTDDRDSRDEDSSESHIFLL
jgi:hypothetical protein